VVTGENDGSLWYSGDGNDAGVNPDEENAECGGWEGDDDLRRNTGLSSS